MSFSTGIGFRRDLAEALLAYQGELLQFIELAPENWAGIGGKWRKVLERAAEKYPITSHGLSLSLGSPDPLDFKFLKTVKEFLAEFSVQIYSEHLSFTKCDNAHVHELLPIPFREDAAHHVAERIRQAQDFLERPIAIENVSYYTPVAPEISESEFLSIVLEESNCQLLLDVNNVYVNAFNHQYDAREFLSEIPLERVAYIHMAGHEQRTEDLIIDTHAAPIIDPVFDLFAWVSTKINPVPVLLERDYNIPELNSLLEELSIIHEINSKSRSLKNAA
jgi:uncharacterized protein (UPF0276 family)